MISPQRSVSSGLIRWNVLYLSRTIRLIRYPSDGARTSHEHETLIIAFIGSYLFPALQATSFVMPFLLIHVLDCLAFFLFFYLFIAFRDHRRRRGLSYPPGPPSHPIIGNLLDVPNEAPWIAYAEMSKKHGMGITLLTAPYQPET
jgi:hypothetical protein